MRDIDGRLRALEHHDGIGTGNMHYDVSSTLYGIRNHVTSKLECVFLYYRESERPKGYIFLESKGFFYDSKIIEH